MFFFNVLNVAQTESVFVCKCFFFVGERAIEQRQVLIFSCTLLCISLLSVRDSGLFMISKERREVELFWPQGRGIFTLIYQTRRLASYYLEYSLTSAHRLCEADLFTTCLGKITQGWEAHTNWDCFDICLKI